MALKVLQSQIEFSGKLLRLRTDKLELSSGRIQALEIVEHQGAVAIVPVDSETNVWLVRQYRHPAGEVLLEIPAGTLDPGENPADCALRETREEIGMAPRNLTPMGMSFIAPGYSTERLFFFLARDLLPAALQPDEDEELEIHKHPLSEAWDRVRAGEIRDVKTIAGLALAIDFLAHEAD